jgi:pimeloyl-ACP methyl ester carboxylesterase
LGEALAALTIGTAGRVLGSPRVQSLADRRLAGRSRQAVNVLTSLTGARTGARVWKSFVVEQRVLLRELNDLDAGLADVQTPTAILNGSADRVVPRHVADTLAATIPGAAHTVVIGAHHLLPHEHPEEVAAAVRQVAARAKRDEWSDGEEAAYGEG